MDWAAEYDGPKFHACLCDPPYGLEFMNKDWDRFRGYIADTGFKNLSLPRQRRRNIKCPECGKYIYDHVERACTCGGVGRAQMATYEQFCYDWIQAIKPHLLPGAFILAFASSRGWHRLACAMEDAGLVMQPSIFVNGLERDVPLCLGWANSQGFPKSTRIDTAVDHNLGKEGTRSRKIYGDGKEYHATPQCTNPNPTDWETKGQDRFTEYNPVTDLARAWQGHRYGGQILRNALEPIIVCQKPWVGKRLDCIVETGAGTINVDGGRISIDTEEALASKDFRTTPAGSRAPFETPPGNYEPPEDKRVVKDSHPLSLRHNVKGRWPQNLVLVHTEFCQRVGERKVKGGSGWAKSGSKASENTCMSGPNYTRPPKPDVFVDADGLETVSTWRCLIACPECGHTWLAVDKEICPECKAMGEWQCAVRRLGEQGGKNSASYRKAQPDRAYTDSIFPKPKLNRGSRGHNDSGDCTRYFFNADWSLETAEQLAKVDPAHYCPKSSRRERDAGLLGAMPCVKCGKLNSRTHLNDKGEEVPCRRNGHETIKPLTLTRYLATLLLPPPEYAPRRILIPFFGVGSEGIGAMLADFEEIVGIEMDAEYCTIGEARMKYWASRPEQMRLL